MTTKAKKRDLAFLVTLDRPSYSGSVRQIHVRPGWIEYADTDSEDDMRRNPNGWFTQGRDYDEPRYDNLEWCSYVWSDDSSSAALKEPAPLTVLEVPEYRGLHAASVHDVRAMAKTLKAMSARYLALNRKLGYPRTWHESVLRWAYVLGVNSIGFAAPLLAAARSAAGANPQRLDDEIAYRKRASDAVWVSTEDARTWLHDVENVAPNERETAKRRDDERARLAKAAAPRNLCPLCGEDLDHPSQKIHGEHACNRIGAAS